MKKALILVSASALIFVLAGCAKQQAQNQNQNQNQNQAQNQNQNGGIISSIKDAIGLGKKMKCTYTMKIGSETDTYVTYVEGKRYKSESEFNGKTQYSVSDGQNIYSWNNNDKIGTKMDTKCMEDLKKPEETKPSGDSQAPPSFENPEDQFDNAIDTKCESVSAIDFSIPSDVNFKDQCEELKKMMESLEKLKSQMPTVPQGSIPGASL